MRIVLLAISLFVISCGNNAAEQAAVQQRRDDSIRNAAVAETQRKFEQKEALEGELTAARNTINALRQRIETETAELQVAIDRLERIKQFKVLRTAAEREQQISEQTIVITRLETSLNNAKSHLQDIEQKAEAIKEQLARF
jgi:hypothetical protein